MKYFNSDQVKVYPCAYRGTKEDSQLAAAKIYDPDSRLNTEYNITKSGSCGLKGNENRSENSYIISGPENANVAGKLEFVICGYHFDIDYLADDMIDAGGILGNLCINIGRDSKVLLPVTATDDTPATLDQNEKFVGLGIANDNELSNKKFIRIFDSAGNLFISNLFASSFYGGKGLDTAGDTIVAIGNYNDPGTGGIFQVGDGSSNTNRHNAIYVYKDYSIDQSSTTVDTTDVYLGRENGKDEDYSEKFPFAKFPLAIRRNPDDNSYSTEITTDKLGFIRQKPGILQTDDNGEVKASKQLQIEKLIVADDYYSGNTLEAYQGTVKISGTLEAGETKTSSLKVTTSTQSYKDLETGTSWTSSTLADGFYLLTVYVAESGQSTQLRTIPISVVKSQLQAYGSRVIIICVDTSARNLRVDINSSPCKVSISCDANIHYLELKKVLSY